jgi:hypothetical protein
MQQQLANIIVPSTGERSYADIARTPPGSQPSNLRSLSINTTPSTGTDTLYCTLDTSQVEEGDKNKANPGTIRRAIETVVQNTEGQEGWRCVVVTKDPKNPERIRVACRNEAELMRVKEAVKKTSQPGTRMLRDQTYPVKVDNTNRIAILDTAGDLQPGVVEMLEKENDVKIAKLVWLSKKDSGKAYGSMVVYVSKSSEVTKLLQGQYFHIAGESAYTRVFEPRLRPDQCYQCQEIGYKAYSCNKPQRCAKYAQTGHRHSECKSEIPKCVPCGGPHESYNRNCRTLYPAAYV